MNGKQEVVCSLFNGTIFNDLERPSLPKLLPVFTTGSSLIRKLHSYSYIYTVTVQHVAHAMQCLNTKLL